MRLRSIHIKGFKSFPLDTKLHFNERVTGVVGPNGSGKSNIVDAIRWVLGEQKTSELRLSAMSDVLFNGTKKRKKSGLAEVTLEFDNTKNLIPSEYNQVSVSRLLFRNGESEYRINDVPCRLKDIRSLFVDTGVGFDSYAIIALNMVDDILTDSNGSRRMMFEQASGISKYKKRKKETFNKLEVTNADLDRVEDLLFEIQNNLDDLEKQARRVTRFLTIKDQYKDISVQLHFTRFDEINNIVRKVSGQVTEETSKYRTFETDLRVREAELQKQKKDIISNEQELSIFQHQINEMLDEIRKSESNKQLYQQQKLFNQQKEKNLRNDQEVLTRQIETLRLAIERIQEQRDKEIIIHQAHQKQYEQFEQDYIDIKQKYQSVKADHDELNQRKRVLEDRKFQLEKAIAVDENQIVSLNSLIERKGEKQKQLGDEIRLMVQSRKEREANSQILSSKLSLLKDGILDRKGKIEKLSNERDEIRLKKEKILRVLDARVNEFDLIKSMIDSLEGFPESIRFLNKKWKTKAPLLTDIIYAPEAYKLAIESFLDPYLNYYVVEETEEAIEALSLLHGAQKGKANFFILDKMDENVPVTNTLGGLKPAIDCLEFEEKYLKLISRLLQNVFITDLDILDVELIAEEMESDNFHILDKNGSFITSGFSISGGSVGLFEGKKLGRKKNQEKLDEEIRDLKKQNLELDGKLIQLRNQISNLEREMDQSEIDHLQKEMEGEKFRLVELEMGIASSEKQLTTLVNETQQHTQEIQQVRISIESRKTEIVELDLNLKNLFDGNLPSDLSLQAYSERLSKASELKNAHQIELIKHQSILDNLVNDLDYKRTDLEKSEQLFETNTKTLEEVEILQRELEDKMILLEKELIERYEQKKEKESNLSDVEKFFYAKRATISDLEETISSLRRNMHQSQFLINELKEKLHDQEYRLQSVKDRLKIEFNLELSELKDFVRIDLPIGELEEKHDRLKRKIENFGEVNTLAIEAYDEMKLRFDTISKQKEDILEAKESLLKTIDAIEEIATKKYLETFEVVNVHFKKVFTSLFNEGDTCDIIMEDPENPLESRIDIIAKPKGKRPKTLNQLSGGEKTLTAIALLFSLYLYKPAPFCIFDEVDAPLDDANIQKFNKIVKEFSRDSQFIIITHNKATMASVDVLYGVFMQEMGVSEVAAVDFRNFEHFDTIEASN